QRRRGTADRNEYRHLAAYELGRQCGQSVVCAASPTKFNGQVLAFNQATLTQPSAERSQHIHRILWRSAAHKPDHRYRRLLRARPERPDCRPAEQRDELAPVHSITWSAMASSPGGKLRPNALAVLRLITNSNLVDCMTGRSAGFSPLRIRPVYTPAWRYASVMIVP